MHERDEDEGPPLVEIGLDPSEFIRGARRILDAADVQDEDGTDEE